jgi:tetratricopeptide (TPR) repeat protein
MVANPRIDDLRRRLEREPSPRLQAQLAEELRKNGGLDEAIALSRAAVERQPGYASARITLARALMDKGDYRSAAAEFEEVLRTAPDNILASRFLGECLEALGDLVGALRRHQATLALLPGDAGVARRVEVLAAKLPSGGPLGGAAAVGAPALADEAGPLPPPLAGPAPDELPTLIETGPEAGQAVALARGSLPAPQPLEAEPPEEELPLPEAPWPGPVHEAPSAAAAAPPGPAAGEAAPSPLPAPPPVATATLAELYARQGLPESAAEVYRAVLDREPDNARARERLAELAPGPPPEGAPDGDHRELRRRAIQDTITRLEGFLRSVRR